MKTACWTLFGLSLFVSLLGAISRFGPRLGLAGVAPMTYWNISMALLAYAATLNILTLEGKRPI